MILRIANQFVAIILCLTLLEPAVAAEENTETTDNLRSWRWLDVPYDVVSRNVTSVGRSIDTWLAGDALGGRVNETYLKIRLSQATSNIDGYDSKLKISGRLDLPGASERLKLTFESDVEELNSLGEAILGSTDASADIGALTYEHEEVSNWRFSHDIGLRAKLPADPFYRFRAGYLKQLNDSWSFGFKQKIWYYDREGWGYDSQASFNRHFNEGRYFQLLSRLNYNQEREFNEYAQIARIVRSLEENTTVTYEAGVLGGAELSNEITDHYLQIRYRTAIYQDWLMLEVAPQVLASIENDWRTEFRLSVNIDMIFADF